MITLKTLSVRNFLSYGNNVTVFQLDQPGTTLILGEDLDNTADGTGSNGVGKTTMLQAIVYALYDKIISDDYTLDGLVNNINDEQMEVTLEFIANNGVTYKVIRQRKMKKHGPEKNRVFLYEGEHDISVDMAGTTKKIEEIIGMPFEMFTRIIVFSAANASFLKLPASHPSQANQKSFVEDLFGITIVTQKAEKLKAYIKDTKAALDIKKSVIDAQKAERERHLVQIDNAQRRLDAWEVQRRDTIRNLQAKLARIDGVDVEGQRAVHAKVRQVETTRSKVKQEKMEASRTCKQHVTAFTKYEGEILVLRDNKCPHCKQQYAGAADEIDKYLDLMGKLEADIATLSEQMKEQTEMLEDLDALYDQLVQQITVDNVEEIARIQADANNIRDRVEELKNEVNPHYATIQDLKAVKFDEINYEDIDKIQKELDHQNFLLKLLTKSDSFVRKTLISKYLPFLNQRLQYYLQMLGLPHVVQFQDDLSVEIALGAAKMRFGQLSNGQKARIDFAFSVAFKDVRERLHGRINVCMFDEVLDFGLDAVGVTACARVIKHLARTEGVSMYVITHRSEIDSAFDRKMTIQMIKRFSYVKVE
jgi:DNA repair exonuclease SbcCD ATPase subunit